MHQNLLLTNISRIAVANSGDGSVSLATLGPGRLRAIRPHNGASSRQMRRTCMDLAWHSLAALDLKAAQPGGRPHLLCILGRRYSPHAAVGPDIVVAVAPGGNLCTGLLQALDPALIEALVA